MNATPLPHELEELRRRAEASLPSAPSGDDARLLLHELSVHQAELTMQNDELRTTQEALESSRQRWHQLFQQAPVAYLTVGSDGLVQDANAEAAQLLGDADTLRHMAFSRLAVPADQLRLHAVLVDAQARVERPPVEVRLRGRVDPFPAEVRAAAVEAPHGAQVLVVLRDLRERVRAEEERRRLAGQVERLQRLDALGRMAGAVAHEINNVLVVVMGSSSAAAEEWRQHPSGAEFEEILAAARRGRDLTQRLLGFARATPARLEPVSLLEVAREVAALLRKLVRGVATVVEVVEGPGAADAVVRGDGAQLHQALLNLGINALDALGEQGGHVTFHVRQGADLPPEEEKGGETCARACAQVAVVDDGPGFSRPAMEHVFEPFFTTKGAGKGTGLGLAMVFGVARDHHGVATVESQPGQGARVVLQLPLLKQPPTQGALAHAAVPRADPTGGRALVVDDEPAVARALARQLTQRGWKVVTAASGPEGLEQMRTLRPGVGLVFIDLLMPGMSGLETLAGLRQLDAAVPVVLTSGYSHERVPADVLGAPRTAFLPKPFEGADLDEVIRRVGRVER
jgi:PAS domain S-box-containing protein